MLTIIQTVAGAGQFDGALFISGLVDFTDAAFPQLQGPDQIYIVDSVSLRGDGSTTITSIECYLVVNAAETTPTARMDIVELANETGFSNIGCHIPVPRNQFSQGVGVSTADSWVLKLITTGKTVNASFVVSFHIGERSRGT